MLTKNKSSLKSCAACNISLASYSERCFCLANVGIKTEETTVISHIVLNFLSGRVAVDNFRFQDRREKSANTLNGTSVVEYSTVKVSSTAFNVCGLCMGTRI